MADTKEVQLTDGYSLRRPMLVRSVAACDLEVENIPKTSMRVGLKLATNGGGLLNGKGQSRGQRGLFRAGPEAPAPCDLTEPGGEALGRDRRMVPWCTSGLHQLCHLHRES
jgi:hypothetical protein